ncbi:phasin [Mangrovicella endophytica]|uniref:phasin n=1 Tax=Mangrovicella endophytica TaxID=2066697 RepID=UPI000C9E056C|nr:phasin [Mangrovicella endophytica]
MADMNDNAINDPFGLGGGIPGLQGTLGLDPAKFSETFRAMTEKSMEQSRQAYARMKSAAEDATKTLESTMENAHQGSLSLSRKAIEAMRNNAEMGFEHLDRMMGVKSFAELIELQTSYVRKQIETATDQAKELQTLSQSLAQDMLKPGREAFQKAADTVRRS